ncbi:MAG TPA: hypothetical protein VKV27_16755 [Solirubrobacteraceae bacterium]|nr:hypothetical protein [Solirubrobacteraceae bacterium]
MGRAAVRISIVVALLHIHLHLAHRFHGPPFDYLGLALAAAASWIGLPGPGEPLLLAAGVLAAHHRLDLASVLVVAFVAATAGGIAGWLIGLRLGYRVLTAPGPLRWLRVRSVQRGEELFARRPVFAVLMTPAFVAGIHRVPSRVYQPINLISAAAWTVAFGVGGYLIGPPVLDVLNDAGTAVTVAVVVAVAAIVALEVRRRLRRPTG